MNETITIFAENPDEETSLVLHQLIDLLNQENVEISNIIKKEDSESKSIFVTSIVIPITVGLTSAFIYDFLKIVGTRLIGHINGKKIIKVQTTKKDGSVNSTDVEIGNVK